MGRQVLTSVKTSRKRDSDEPAASSGPLVPTHVAKHASCLLLKVGQVIFRLLEGELADLGLRIRHYSVLAALIEIGAVSQQDLGAYLRIDSATMVATIDDLESMRLVARSRDVGDRRRYILTLTGNGRATLETIDRLIDDFDLNYLGDITGRQRENLRYMLTKLSEGDVLADAFDAQRGGRTRKVLSESS